MQTWAIKHNFHLSNLMQYDLNLSNLSNLAKFDLTFELGFKTEICIVKYIVDYMFMYNGC